MNVDSESHQKCQSEYVREADTRSTTPISCNEEQCQQKNGQGDADPNYDSSDPAPKQAFAQRNLEGPFDQQHVEQDHERNSFRQGAESAASLPEASTHRSVVGETEQSLIASNIEGERPIHPETNVVSPSSSSSPPQVGPAARGVCIWHVHQKSSSSSSLSASQAHDEDPTGFVANRPIEHVENKPITHPLVRMEELIAMEKKSGPAEQALLDVTFSKPLPMGEPSIEKSRACLRPVSTTHDTDLDMPGEYYIVHDETLLSGTLHVPDGCDIVGFLCAGTLVRVVEVLKNECENLVRGRVQTPEGWISLLDTQTGYRWAFRVKPTHRVEETPNWCAATPHATQVVLPASNDTVGAVCRKPRAKAMCRRSHGYAKKEDQVSSLAAHRSSAISASVGPKKGARSQSK